MEAILNLLEPIGIKEIAKTGIIALFREVNGGLRIKG
jgi:acetolactate synthase small subunit